MSNTIIKCCECGKEYDTSKTGRGERLAEKKLCFYCDFWMEKIAWTRTERKDQVVRVKGEHYFIEKDCPKAYQGFLGFGGKKFVIQFHDGRRVVSRNLWSQGTIPEHFRDRIPNNAVFVWVQDCRIRGDCGNCRIPLGCPRCQECEDNSRFLKKREV